MKTKTKSVRDMYIAYSNKKLKTKHKNIRTAKSKMDAIGGLTNTEYYYIVENFFELASDNIVLGGSLYIPNIGYIFIEKKPRLVGSKAVDWAKTHEYKKQLLEEGKELWNKETETGEKYWFYLEDEYYLRWNLKRSKNKLISKFIFKPTHNNPNHNKVDRKGNPKKTVLGTKGKLVKANKENPNLHLIYVGKLNNIK